MQSKARFLGHPIHPVLVVFPLGLLAAAAAFDIVALIQGDAFWYRISFWLIAAGIIGGLCAAVFGAIDWFAIPRRTRAWRIGLLHGGINIVVVTMFAVSWWIRDKAGQIPSMAALTLSFVAVALSFVAGWLGGELVDRLGVGVEDNANLNAPSSLSPRAGKVHEFPLRKAG